MGSLTRSQKIIAWFFIAALSVSVVFIAVRIFQKPTYDAREERQCDILAASTLMLFIEKTELSPDIWETLSGDEIVLAIDHRAVPGDWNVKLTARRSPDDETIALKAEAASGWNSRSPKSATRYAVLFDIKSENLRISSREVADFILPDETDAENRVLPFVYLNEQTPPVKIEARITKFEHPDDQYTYLALKLKI